MKNPAPGHDSRKRTDSGDQWMSTRSGKNSAQDRADAKAVEQASRDLKGEFERQKKERKAAQAAREAAAAEVQPVGQGPAGPTPPPSAPAVPRGRQAFPALAGEGDNEQDHFDEEVVAMSNYYVSDRVDPADIYSKIHHIKVEYNLADLIFWFSEI